MKIVSRTIHSEYTTAKHLVLLHGWGMSSHIWQPCIDVLSRHYHLTLVDLPGFGKSDSALSDEAGLDKYVGELLESLREVMPAQFSLLGFSLGGMLAVKLAERYPDSVQRIITVASNAVFVANDEWTEAMADDVYRSFYSLAEQSPAVALKRFLALQASGADNEKTVLKRLRALSLEEQVSNEQVLRDQPDKKAPSHESLLQALQLLTHLDNRQSMGDIKQPLLCLFGENDQLVPVAAAEKIKCLSETVDRVVDITINIVKGASHAVFLSHQELFCSAIDEFMGLSSSRRNKMAVAKSFSKAAASYDDVAELQRNVGKELLTHLPVRDSAELVVDLGCGTGYFLPSLAEQTKAKQMAAVDLAEGMLNFARQHRNGREYWWLCGDAESLPLADNSVDMIFSSLAIQWCESNENLFSEINRVLKPGGQFIFSTLGPGTLIELRQAWRAVDDYVHVNHFDADDNIYHAIEAAGLVQKQWHEQSICLQYHKLTELTRELKSLGAHNVNVGRPEGLMGKQRIKAFKAAYETQRNQQGLLPATYQVWYGVVEKAL